MTLAPPQVLGSTYPRLYTKPLATGASGPCGCGCSLTPATSYGFEVEDFARDILKHPLDPWQRWLVIHAGEFSVGRKPRFRQVLTLVARQNGKTELLVILALYWLLVDRVELVLGTSTNLDSARDAWKAAVRLAQNTPDIAQEITSVRRANGEQELATVWGGSYKIAASNGSAARGKTVNRLIMDELREHQTDAAYAAAAPTITAIWDAQNWMISNAGSDKSVVLNEKREQALEELANGGYNKDTGRPTDLGLFEWSSPDGMAATDLEALAMANPNLGRRIDMDSLLGDAYRAQASGGSQLADFLTEHHCRRVPLMDPAVDMEAWQECATGGDLTNLRDKVALCLDVSIDELHATVVAAAQDGEKTRVDFIAQWEGQSAVRDMCASLPGILARVKPRVLGWFPNGPAASAAASLAERDNWPPPGVEFEPIRGNITAVCMGFAEQVRSHNISHSAHQVIEAHVRAAEKLHQGDGWRFTRRKAGYVDAAYAAAGAVHLARTLPADEIVGGFFA